MAAKKHAEMHYCKFKTEYLILAYGLMALGVFLASLIVCVYYFPKGL